MATHASRPRVFRATRPSWITTLGAGRRRFAHGHARDDERGGGGSLRGDPTGSGAIRGTRASWSSERTAASRHDAACRARSARVASSIAVLAHTSRPPPMDGSAIPKAADRQVVGAQSLRLPRVQEGAARSTGLGCPQVGTTTRSLRETALSQRAPSLLPRTCGPLKSLLASPRLVGAGFEPGG